MQKIIKKYGSSFVIIFDPEDIKINELIEGDVIEMTITKIKHINKRK